jgi:hypothetical protein
MPFAGYTGDFNYTNYTPLDNTADAWDYFRSAYKNFRFGMQPTTTYQLTLQDVANLPGLAYRAYGDTSLWRGLLAYNGISDPLSQINVGLTISIPAKADITQYLSRQVASVTSSQVTI